MSDTGKQGIPRIDIPDLGPSPTGMPPSGSAAPPARSVLLQPTVAQPSPRPFEGDPSVLKVEDGVNFCPGTALCFDARLSGGHSGKPLGISLHDPVAGRYDFVCRLEDLPLRTWVRLTDRQGRPVVFELCALADPTDLYVRWTPLGSITPGYAPPAPAAAPDRRRLPWGKLAVAGLTALAGAAAARGGADDAHKKPRA